MRNMKYEHSCRQGAGSYHYWCRLSSMRQPPYPFHHYHQHHCHCHHLNDEDDDEDHHLVLLYCSEEGFSARKVPNSLRQRFKGEQPEAQSLSSLSPSSSTSPSGNFQHVQLQIETEDIVKGPGVKNT